MKSILRYFFLICPLSVLACAGGGWGDETFFYNLFQQTHISAEEYYPFLRDDFNVFFQEEEFYDNAEGVYPHGNLKLWKEILKDWNLTDIHKAVYEPLSFDWGNKNSKIEKQARTYIEFANECSQSISALGHEASWDYEVITKQQSLSPEALLTKALSLKSKVSNQQLIGRYFYQIVRILRYSKRYAEAIELFNSQIKDKFPTDEIYYYSTDQVAGCYYNEKEYDKAAFLFTKVLNQSVDRKKSAFLSYNFCARRGAEGKSFFEGVEDEKDLLLMVSLRDFSDEISNIQKFIQIDENDPRVELLFMRALSNVEREVWPKDIGSRPKSLPSNIEKTNYRQLLQLAEKQIQNSSVKRKEFWKILSSYLSFVGRDINTAKNKLAKVNSFKEQKEALTAIYEVFSWESITSMNEKFILEALEKYSAKQNDEFEFQYDIRDIIKDKIANTYYRNDELAKAFLVHNEMRSIENLGSLELLNDLERFYYKPSKSAFEKKLHEKVTPERKFIDFVNHHKGVYYLHHGKSAMAVEFFEKAESDALEYSAIPISVFSNNTAECFNCDEKSIMVDQVYKAKMFDFMKDEFSRKDLARYLVKLEELTQSENNSEAKLSNYLLGNYFFNISNTGYYRGTLTNRSRFDHHFFGWDSKSGEDIIAQKAGYNLSEISYFSKKYFNLSDHARKFYQKVIELSTDKELNARCLYLLAKCDLNDFYNSEKERGTKIPPSSNFKTLKDNYSSTDFHRMIIKECSYYSYYCSHY